MKQHRLNTHGTVAIVAPAIAREGITKQIANQIIGLLQKDVKICLIVLARSNVRLLQEYGVDMSQVPVLQLDQSLAYLSPQAFISSVRLIRPILRYLEEHQITGVIAHSPYAHFVMRLTKLASPLHKTRFRLIQYFHGLQYSEYPIRTIRRFVVNNLNKWLAERYDDAHVSVSEAVRQEIMQHLIKIPNHLVLYNSISKRCNWSMEAKQSWEQVHQLLQHSTAVFKILIPNRIDYNKGQLFFLNVLEQFLSENEVLKTDIAVFVAGDGPQRQELEQAVRQKKLERTIRLTGALPNAAVQKLMQQVQLVVVPSFKEGLPFTVLEALNAKCVVLASCTGGVPEIIADGKTGFLFEPGNSNDCLKKLTYIYYHRNENLLDGEAVDDTIQAKFSLNKNTEKLLHLILTLHKQ